MSIPVPGPPCTLPAPWSGVYSAEWVDAARADGSLTEAWAPYPQVFIYDALDGQLRRPVPLGGGVVPVYGWMLGDRCYGMTYRQVFPLDALDDPATVHRLREMLAPGSCCYTQVKMRADADANSPFFLALAFPDFYDACYNYDSHSAPACERIEGLQCCARTHGGGYNDDTGEFDGEWDDLFIREGPSRWNCENWTVDGTWAPNLTCHLEWYPGSGNCSTTCDVTPWACLFCGYECGDATLAKCADLGGTFRRYANCGTTERESNQRDCVVGHWQPAKRILPEHAPKRDFQNLAPRTRPGLFEFVSYANPTDYGPSEGNCRYHWARPRKRADGRWVVRMCGTTNATETMPPSLFSEPEKTHRSFEGGIRKREGTAKFVVPIQYRPRCLN